MQRASVKDIAGVRVAFEVDDVDSSVNVHGDLRLETAIRNSEQLYFRLRSAEKRGSGNASQQPEPPKQRYFEKHGYFMLSGSIL